MPAYNGLSEVDDFLTRFEREVPKLQWFNTLKWELRTTPARWWGVHRQSFEDWNDY